MNAFHLSRMMKTENELEKGKYEDDGSRTQNSLGNGGWNAKLKHRVSPGSHDFPLLICASKVKQRSKIDAQGRK
jgi:hypothetical protein